MNNFTFNGIAMESTCPKHVLDSIHIIHTSYPDELSLDTLAKSQNLNKCYLCQIFKAYTNLTVTEFINKVRLEKSKYYLQHSSDSILTIALNTGFNNVTYYNRLFKKAYGITPLQYRKQVAYIDTFPFASTPVSL